MPKAAERRPRTGLLALKAKVKVRGLSAIDLRTLAARALVAWRDELLRDLGGKEQVSAQKLALADFAARTKLCIDHVDSFILELPSLINRRKKSLIPIVRERTALVDSFTRIIGMLGLERVPKQLPSLAEVLAQNHAEKAAERAAACPARDESGRWAPRASKPAANEAEHSDEDNVDDKKPSNEDEASE